MARLVRDSIKCMFKGILPRQKSNRMNTVTIFVDGEVMGRGEVKIFDG